MVQTSTRIYFQHLFSTTLNDVMPSPALPSLSPTLPLQGQGFVCWQILYCSIYIYDRNSLSRILDTSRLDFPVRRRNYMSLLNVTSWHSQAVRAVVGTVKPVVGPVTAFSTLTGRIELDGVQGPRHAQRRRTPHKKESRSATTEPNRLCPLIIW